MPPITRAGFTLIEMIMVVLLVGILSGVALVRYHDFRDDAKGAVTRDELRLLKRAIVGDARAVAGGQYTFAGYEADMGGVPANLTALVLNPATGTTVQTYNPMTRRGWRGPYIDDSTQSNPLNDGWDRAYLYNSAARTIRSRGPNGIDNAGGGDDLQINF